MRDWVGLHTASLSSISDAEHKRRTRDFFADIDYFLRDLSRGVARIQNGEVPDGSGDPIGSNGTLTDYWFKPGISETFLANMSSGPGGGGTISSTSDQDKGFINLGNTEYIDEDGNLTGFNVTAPAAAVHIQPGVSGTTTLSPVSDLDTKWDGPRNAAQALAGGTLASAVNVNDGSTLWAGFSNTLGLSPQQFNMGTITPNKLWTVNIYVCILSGTWTAGDLEFHIRDSAGNQYSYSESGTFADATATFPTFKLKTFTINGAGTSTGTATANSIKIGIAATAPVGAYCACTYIEITTGGSSDVARWNNAGASLFGKINSSGYVGIGTASDTLSSMLTVESDAAASVVSIFKGATSQSGDLTEWQSQAGGILSRIKSDGTFDGPISTTSAISVLDSQFSILDNADNTKTLKFELGGATAGADLLVAYSSTADRTLGFTLAGTAGNDLTLSATLTGDRVITIPDQTGTLPTVQNAATITGAWSVTGAGVNALNVGIGTAGDGFTNTGMIFQEVASGFKVEIQGNGLSADRVVTIQDADLTLMGINEAVTISNKTLSTTGNHLVSSTAATGVDFMDTSVNTKKLRFVLSGAVGDNSIVISSTSARAYTFPDTALNITGRVATSDLTTQGAAIAATTIYAVPSNGQGFYQVSWMATVTRAATTSSVLGGTNGFQVVFTDPNDSVVKTSAPTTVTAHTSAGNTTGTSVSGTFCAYCKASTNLQYSFDYTSVGGTTMQYDLSIRAIYIG